jgi:tRNA (guanine-N7-)-methyltransferase
MSRDAKPKFYSNHRSRLSDKEQFSEIKNHHKEIFNTQNNKNNILEIGFGNGNSIINISKNKNINCFGIESYINGIQAIEQYINRNNINNVFIYKGDAIEIIEENFPDNFLDEILLFFPDPWPKNKHRKRRIINLYTLKLFFKKIKKGGILQFSTDHIEYAYNVKNMLSLYLQREILFSTNRRHRSITKYENKAIKKNNIIFDIVVKNI